MSVSRVLRITDGDATGRLREFLSFWWSRIEFEAMLVPIVLPGGREVASQAINDPARLSEFNPFAPLMLSNTASAVGEFVKDNKGPLAVILRPCELRTLIELQKRHRILLPPLDSTDKSGELVIIGIDCPGTLPAEEFTRKIETSGLDAMTRDALNGGAGDGFLVEHLREACQLCDWPVPNAADLTIGVFGTINRQSLLLIARDHSIDARLGLRDLTDALATEADISLREKARSIPSWNNGPPGETARAVSKYPPTGSFSSLLACFTRCTLCADCLDACPLYEGELSGLLGVGGHHLFERPLLADLIKVSRLLASCSGCGMCEEVCEWDIPLTLWISLLSQAHPGRTLLYRRGTRPAPAMGICVMRLKTEG